MALKQIKNNSRLKLELKEGMKGEEPIIKSKTYSKVKPDVINEDLYEVGVAISNLQQLPLVAVKKLEETTLSQE